MENPLQTKQLAAQLNVTSRQIVEWAVAGLLPSITAPVGKGNSRLYSPDVLERGRLLCRLKSANIKTQDIRKLIPAIEEALANELVLSVPHPVQVGRRLYTLCRIPMKGPVLVEGVPPGQIVIPLIALDEMTSEELDRAVATK